MNIFSFIKEHVSILDVAREYVTLKQAGGYWKGHCPFHHEKSASFTVSPHKEIFYCFGCHVGGDVIAFIAKAENCSQIEAVNHLVDRYNIEVPAKLTHEIAAPNADARNHYFDTCKQMAQWCQEQLRKKPAVLDYLHKRGFTAASIDYFTIGYFPGGLQSIKRFMEWMKQHNTLPHDLIEAHIIAQGKTVLYSPFEERIIFPIKDHLGRFCGFGGRTFMPHDERPKYYNSRENDFFTKGSLLFGLDLAKESIQKTDSVFLVEGYTDCMAMVQYGYPNTIATLGTACTAQHLKTLARYANRLYVLYDGDNAGQKAILRLTELCWQVSMELYVVNLPAQDDPASFLHTHKTLDDLLGTAQDIFVFFIYSLGTDFTQIPLNEKVQRIRVFLETIHQMDDPLKQDMLLQRAAKVFDMPFISLQQELRRLAKPEAPETQKLDPTSSQEPLPILEKRLFCAIMYNMDFSTNTQMLTVIEYMPSPLKEVLRKLISMKNSHAELDFALFFDTLLDDEKRYISKLLLEHTESVELAAFEQLVYQLQKKQWKFIVNDIKTKLAHAKQRGDEEQVKQLMQDFILLQKKLMPTPASK